MLNSSADESPAVDAPPPSGRPSHLISLLDIFNTSPRPFQSHDVTLLRALLQYIIQPTYVCRRPV